jgi:hypothetical protein
MSLVINSNDAKRLKTEHDATVGGSRPIRKSYLNQSVNLTFKLDATLPTKINSKRLPGGHADERRKKMMPADSLPSPPPESSPTAVASQSSKWTLADVFFYLQHRYTAQWTGRCRVEK